MSGKLPDQLGLEDSLESLLTQTKPFAVESLARAGNSDFVLDLWLLQRQ